MRYSTFALLAILMIPVSVVEGSPTVVFRGHVGAVSDNLTIVWVERVIEGPLQEGGVIEVYRRSSPSGRPAIDEVKVGDFVEVRGSLETRCCRKTVMLERGDHYLKLLRKVLEADIKLPQGCNGEVERGRNVTFVFFISRGANVTVSLRKGNETMNLFKGYLKGGFYSIEREGSEEEGEREVCILAESQGDRAFGCCRYRVVSGEREAAKRYRNLTVRVLTEAGYPVRNATVYIDGKLYGFTDRKGFLETNLSEGVHEVRVESDYYRTAVVRAGPKLIVVKVGVRAPEVKIYFDPREINGSGNVTLVVKRLGGADISIRVRLTAIGVKVNATELIGVPPFNATLQVWGEGKLVASYGKVKAVLTSRIMPELRRGSTATETQPKTTGRGQGKSTTTKNEEVSAATTVHETMGVGVERRPIHWGYLIDLALIILIASLTLMWRKERFREGTSPPSNSGSAPD